MTVAAPRIAVLVDDEREADIVREAGAQAFLRADAGAPASPYRHVAADAEPVSSEEDHGRTVALLSVPSGRLLDAVPFARLAERAAAWQATGEPFGFAGGLEAADIPRLLPLGPVVLAVDEAVRDPAGELDAAAVAALVSLVQTPVPARASFGGTPDRVFVRDLVEEIEIGAYASERGRRQRVRFSLEAELAPVTGARSLKNVFSYDRMMDAVSALAARAPEPFVETLAEDLAAEMLQDPRVEAITVRVEKLDLGPAAAGIEIRRLRGA